MVLLVCLQVFFSRILDVTLGTLRTIMTVRGKPAIAAAFGFVEVFVWFLAVRSAMQTAGGGVWVALCYAGGFALGTYLGGIIARKYIRGILDVQVITSSRDEKLVEAVRAAGFAVSVLNVNSSEFSKEKFMLVMEINKEREKELEKIVYALDPEAFLMVRETKFIHNGFFK